MGTGRSVVVVACVGAMLTAGIAVAGPYDATVMADSPFLYYRFEEGGGGTAIDTAGGDDNGTYLGGVTLGQPSVTAELGSSGLFAGSDDRIDLPGLGSYSQHSIEMWINTNGLAGGCCTSLYHTDTWGTDGSGSSLHFNVKSGRDIEHAMPGGSPNNVNTPGGAIQDGNWYHVVATYDAAAADPLLLELRLEGRRHHPRPGHRLDSRWHPGQRRGYHNRRPRLQR